MRGRIDCWIDIASYYSYMAFTYLTTNRQVLAAQGVEIQFQPALIAGVMKGSDNTPPWINRAKGRFLALDARRSARAVGQGARGLEFPRDFFPTMALTVAPLRALLYVRRRWGVGRFETLTGALFARFWTPPHANVADEDVLARVLAEVREDETVLPSLSRLSRSHGDDVNTNEKANKNANRDAKRLAMDVSTAGNRMFSNDDVRDIMTAARGDDAKRELRESTAQALARGAFGLPWMWVTRTRGSDYNDDNDDNDDDEGEPFYGSDRWYDVFEFLGVNYEPLKVLPGLRDENKSNEGLRGKDKAKL